MYVGDMSKLLRGTGFLKNPGSHFKEGLPTGPCEEERIVDDLVEAGAVERSGARCAARPLKGPGA